MYKSTVKGYGDHRSEAPRPSIHSFNHGVDDVFEDGKKNRNPLGKNGGV
jgi:hypothetical protein